MEAKRQWNDICNEITDNLEFYAQRKRQHKEIFI